ncbi:MAG: hypothetical protein EXQ87_07465 [Alphaproteobacteria bacterium]|nr:hypothetical protein [Alphaproteobacteria bacterium]
MGSDHRFGNSSQPAGIVLDPFAGSGTTLIAAERTGRKACLVEFDPAYCDVIVKRWQAFTRQSAALDGSGETFSGRAVEMRAVEALQVGST